MFGYEKRDAGASLFSFMGGDADFRGGLGRPALPSDLEDGSGTGGRSGAGWAVTGHLLIDGIWSVKFTRKKDFGIRFTEQTGIMSRPVGNRKNSTRKTTDHME